MKNSTKLMFSVAAAAVVAMGVSVPVIAKSRMGMMFEKVDTNGDGYLDAAELSAARDARFDALDTNNDGVVTREEIAAHRGKMKAEHGKSGKSGKMAEKAFKRMDTDGNGSISQEELEAGMKKRHGKRAEARQGRMMEHMDANNDGKLTKEEMGSHMSDRMMSRLDADGDGRISKAEAEKMHSKWRKKSD